MEQHEHSDENKKHMINLKKLVSVEHDESLSFILWAAGYQLMGS